MVSFNGKKLFGGRKNIFFLVLMEKTIFYRQIKYNFGKKHNFIGEKLDFIASIEKSILRFGKITFLVWFLAPKNVQLHPSPLLSLAKDIQQS